METNLQNINQACQGTKKEMKFENDKSCLEKLDCTYRFEITDSHIKMEMDDNKEYLGNEYSHSKNADKSHQSIATELQNTTRQVKCQEERLEDDKSRFGTVEQMHCCGNTNSNCQNIDNLKKNLDTEVKNISKEVEVKKDRLGSLNSYFENSTDKILIFENTDSSFQDRKDSKFVEMINIKQELKDPQYQIFELENKNYTQDIKYDPNFEDVKLKTERSVLSIKTENSSLEAGNSNVENSDIGFENRFIKIECSDLKTENGYTSSVHPSGSTMLTDSDVVPRVDTMMTDFSGTDTHRHADALPLLTPSEVTVNCHMGAVLTTSESHPHAVTLLTKSDNNKDTSVLKRHEISHSAEWPHQCNVCDRWFKTLSDLNRHYITHNCNLCDKRFKNSSVLKRHMITHSTERPHQCNVCDKRFKTVYVLRTHMTIHSTVRPHLCDVCDKRFKTVEDFTKHVATHSMTGFTSPCRMCDKRFDLNHMLRIHMITQSPSYLLANSPNATKF